jgi:glucosamine-6-phosphate deaminase
MVVVSVERFGGSAADVVLSKLPRVRPRLGVATGGTPMRLYAELARRSRSGEIDLADASLVSLDEYVGLGVEDPRSYAAYVRSVIAEPLRVRSENVVVPDGSGNPDACATAFDDRISALGGVDVQILGIGGNGHLAFNEPGSAFDSPTRVITLADETRSDNARYFGGRVCDVPSRAITQGLATIGRARSIVLLAEGSAKAVPLKAALRGAPAPRTPASMLQLHSDVTVVADTAAAALLVD